MTAPNSPGVVPADAPRRLPVPPIPQGTSFIPDHRWCFTDAEAKLFETLVRNPIATPEMIAPLLPSCTEFVEGITRKVGPFGVQILPERGGWQLVDRLGFWHYFPPADTARFSHGRSRKDGSSR